MNSHSTAQNISQTGFVDWLRGLAAILVVIFHVQLHVVTGYPKNPVPPQSVTHYLVFGTIDLGKYAVAMFFMISGFLIPSSLRAPSSDLRSFAIHRFCRLYPAYWVSLLVYVLLATVSSSFPEWGTPFSAGQVIVNITMFQKFFLTPDVIGAYWTLQIELIFYALVALLFSVNLLDKQGILVLVFLTCALLCALLRKLLGLGAPIALFLALALMFLGDMYRTGSKPGSSDRQVHLLAMMVAAAIVAVCLLGYGQDGPRYAVSYCGALVTFVLARQFGSSMPVGSINSPIAKFLADSSYSVYLLHGSIGLAIAHKLNALGLSAPLTIVLTLAALLPLCFLVFKTIEDPAIRYGRKLSAKARTARSAIPDHLNS